MLQFTHSPLYLNDYIVISKLKVSFHLFIVSLLVIQLYLRVVVEDGLEYLFFQIVSLWHTSCLFFLVT